NMHMRIRPVDQITRSSQFPGVPREIARVSRDVPLNVYPFFHDTATPENYTLSLHDALPICRAGDRRLLRGLRPGPRPPPPAGRRSEEHTSELQSRFDLVCRLLLEKKKLVGSFTVTDPDAGANNVLILQSGTGVDANSK